MSVFTGVGGPGAVRFPGEIVWLAWDLAEEDPDWIECDGTAYPDGTYPALEERIGTTYGTDGAGTWRVPDLRGRAPVGVGTGTGLTARTLGAQFGTETHALTEAELAPHSHTAGSLAASVPAAEGGALGMDARCLVATGSTEARKITSAPDPTDSIPVAGTLGSTGSGTAHPNVQPSLALMAFIYTGG